ncbi:Sodium/calcium exchanger protein-domain-containing protein [Rhodocollybia butyracea]|uniref:Sodium/calcium exchanger protein-domain-containing protein n=1 Tax=Rhodocollybia butyracea TaxID=206335 RepID=A0A9P5U6G4_9AGAR|nr:Sodium/calcium exchanger protein-domain-containing protein [Rhodocollybia butyracea]
MESECTTSSSNDESNLQETPNHDAATSHLRPSQLQPQASSDSVAHERNIFLRRFRRRQENKQSEQTSIVRAGTLSSLLTPQKKMGPAPSMFQSFRSIVCSSWINLLLLCIPVSWALNFATPDNDTLIFVFSFLAIIPLAKLLAFATDELSMRVGQTLAGLLNATLGNAVELIVAIIALTQCKLHIVQSSLIGSMLSNLLLVLGMCFFAGGVRFSEQGFGLVASQLNSSLLTIAVIAILLPAAFYYNVTKQTDSDEGQDLLKVSHGVALILLFSAPFPSFISLNSVFVPLVYGGYLFFQLYSHSTLYNDETDIIKSIKYAPRPKKAKSIQSSDEESHSRNHQPPSSENLEMHDIVEYDPADALATPAPSSSKPLLGQFSKVWDNASSAASLVTSSAANVRKSVFSGDKSRDLESGQASVEESGDEEEVPQMNLTTTIVLLVVVTVFVAVTAEWLVDSIDGLTDSGAISQEFVGIILLPIVGNAAEHVTAVTVSVKDKLTLSLGVAVGSTLQIALFVIPFIVILGWIMGKPLTLLFDPYESISLFLAVLTVNYSVQDGKSNWLEGMILMCLYLILAVTFWYYPGSDPSGLLNQCT